MWKSLEIGVSLRVSQVVDRYKFSGPSRTAKIRFLASRNASTEV